MIIRVGFRCDAGPQAGVGHLARCVALAEELQARGIDVIFLGDMGGLEWPARQLRTRGIPLLPAPEQTAGIVGAARELQLAAVVLDSYELPADDSRLLREAGITVLAVVDGDLRGQDADLFLDQNLAAEEPEVPVPDGTTRLAGLHYVLIRDSVRATRPTAPRLASVQPHRPNVLAFFGGTDASGAAPTIAHLLVDTDAPFEATIVASSDSTSDALRNVELRSGQQLRSITPTDHLHALAAQADLVVSASGTSTWELMCIGAPTALVWVADNQRRGYEAAIQTGACAGLGQIRQLSSSVEHREAVTTQLRRLLSEPELRDILAARAWALVDGLGRERVADALLARISAGKL